MKKSILHHKLITAVLGLTTAVVIRGEISPAAERTIPQTLMFSEIKTAQGIFQASRKDQGSSRHTNTLTLNGKVILEESDHAALFVAAAYPDQSATRLILLEMDAGENRCPVSYKVIEIKADGGTEISKAFGNCNDQARAHFENNAWRIDIPKNGGTSSDEWFYSNGKVTETPGQEQTSRTVTGSPATKNEAISEDEARAFIEQWLRLSEKNEDLPAVMGLYADEVDFYKLGRVKKSVIEEDKRKYFGRWPSRKHAVKSISQLGAGLPNERTIAVQFHYTLTGSKKTIQGDANAILVLRKEQGIVIIREKKLGLK